MSRSYDVTYWGGYPNPQSNRSSKEGSPMSKSIVTCPKCGEGGLANPRYVAGTEECEEHIERTCNTCGYKSKEKCKDKEEDKK